MITRGEVSDILSGMKHCQGVEELCEYILYLEQKLCDLEVEAIARPYGCWICKPSSLQRY